MTYLYLAFVTLAPVVSIFLFLCSLVGMGEFYIEYRNSLRDRGELAIVQAVCVAVAFVSVTAFYYSAPVFAREVL